MPSVIDGSDNFDTGGDWSALIEKVVTATGEGYKFADGTLICVGEETTEVAVATPAGASFRTASPITLTFAVAFDAGTPIRITPSARNGATSGSVPLGSSINTSTTVNVAMYAFAYANTCKVLRGYVAYGRWKA